VIFTVNSNAILSNPDFYVVDDLSKKYLVLKLSPHEAANIIDYQVHMISMNSRNNIVPFRICRKDNDTFLYYDITGLMPLADILNTRRFEKHDLIKLLKNISDCVLTNTDLLLYENSYVFSDEYFYVNTETDTVCAVYIPIHMDINFNLTLKEFLANIFTKVKFANPEENAAFLKKLTSLTKQQNFNLYDFRKFLNNESTESVIHTVSQDNEENIPLIRNRSENRDNTAKSVIDLKESILKKKATAEKKIKLNISSRHKEEAYNQEKHPVLQFKYGKNQNTGSIKNEMGIIKKGDDIDYEDEDNKEKNKPPVFLIAVGIQVVVILWSVILEQFLNKKGINASLRYSIIAILIILIDIIVFKYVIINKRLKDNQKSSESANDRHDSEITSETGISNARIIDDSDNIDTSIVNDESAEKVILDKPEMMNAIDPNTETNTSVESTAPIKCQEEDLTEDLDFNNEETVLLAYKKMKNAYLVAENEVENTRQHRIDKETFLIGRNSDLCNLVIKKMVIGRVHAQIQFKEDSFYLIDKGSINGTALNGEKLQAEEEYKLNSGDLIEFANLKYKFIC